MIRRRDIFDADLPAGYDGEFVWDWLDDAWRREYTGIKPMDFDGVVERNGRFLVFETKSGSLDRDPSNPLSYVLPEGQRRTFAALVHDRRWTVVVTAKRQEDICCWWVWTRAGCGRRDGDGDALKTWCATWFHVVSHLNSITDADVT